MAIDACLKTAGIDSTNIDEVALATHNWNPVLTKIKRNANFSVSDCVKEQHDYWKPTLLENRQATQHHWVAVRPVSATGNRFAIGAKVTVSGGGGKQLREVRSGGSFLSQNDLRAYFGLAGYAGPVDVEVRLPGGHRWEWKQLPVDRLHVLELSESASLPKSSIAR